MELRQLECFLSVAKHLHFGKAAEELYIAQPTISDTIRKLEHELGGKLFNRSTRRVTLTPLGEAFYADAQAAYEGVARAYRRGQELARDERTELRVGHSVGDTSELVQAAGTLQLQAPRTRVTLWAMPTIRQVELLRDRRLHVAICWEPDVDDSLQSQSLGTARLVAVVSPAHPFADLASVPLKLLAEEPLLVWPRSLNPPLYDRFAAAMAESELTWTLVGTSVGVNNIGASVLSGFGTGVMIEPIEQARLPNLRYVPLDPPAPSIRRSMLWRRDERNPSVARFVELVGELVNQHSDV